MTGLCTATIERYANGKAPYQPYSFTAYRIGRALKVHPNVVRDAIRTSHRLRLEREASRVAALEASRVNEAERRFVADSGIDVE